MEVIWEVMNSAVVERGCRWEGVEVVRNVRGSPAEALELLVSAVKGVSAEEGFVAARAALSLVMRAALVAASVLRVWFR